MNPGFMQTPIIQSSLTANLTLLKQAPPEILAQYSEKIYEGVYDRFFSIMEDPNKVADMVVTLVQARSLELNNYVGNQALLLRIVDCLPNSIKCFLLNIFVPPAPYPTRETVNRIQTSSCSSY